MPPSIHLFKIKTFVSICQYINIISAPLLWVIITLAPRWHLSFKHNCGLYFGEWHYNLLCSFTWQDSLYIFEAFFLFNLQIMPKAHSPTQKYTHCTFHTPFLPKCQMYKPNYHTFSSQTLKDEMHIDAVFLEDIFGVTLMFKWCASPSSNSWGRNVNQVCFTEKHILLLLLEG